MSQLKFKVTGIAADELFSVSDTASLLGHRAQWIYRRIYSGQIASQIIGGRHVIRGTDIVSYVNAQISYGSVELAEDGGQLPGEDAVPDDAKRQSTTRQGVGGVS